MDLEPKKLSRLDTPVRITETTRLGQVQIEKTPRAILADFVSNRAGYEPGQLLTVFSYILQELIEKTEEPTKKIVLN